jgi:hypothetical protein
VLNGTIHPINEADCLSCGGPVRYTVFQAADLVYLLPFQHERFAATPRFARSNNSRHGAHPWKAKGIRQANAQMNRA